MQMMTDKMPEMMADKGGPHGDRPITSSLSGRGRWIIAALATVIAAAWYLFRPELLFVDKAVNESFPAADVTTTGNAMGRQMRVAMGEFRGLAHETKGTATIYEGANGKHVLRLTGFETSNGPDVHVLLVAANDAADDKAVKDAGYIDLGSLKGNVGDQNYDIPANVNLAKYGACTIWCNRFSVNFGTAPLKRESMDDMDMMSGKAIALANGMFRGLAHETKGTATIYEVAGGQRVLRLTGFETSNGPDVHVLLVAAEDAADDKTVKDSGYLDLGSLKGNIGDQNYDVPTDTDLSKYRACTIWCNRFGVNFGTAPLAMK